MSEPQPETADATGATDLTVGESGTPARTDSIAMRRMLDLARRVAATDVSVLISGESGTGKEVMARFIHDASPRREGPFVALNCAAIPETMLEAMMFGHERGAFTGATERRIGKFELASGGTLLLDEITEMPMALQAKLLRVLQEREVERVGSNRTVTIDTRVLATTNRCLKSAVAQGVLREDIYYRLSVFPLTVPPLRDRREDILPLAQALFERHDPDRSWTIEPAAAERLQAYEWPGNVRELENCVQRAIVLCTDAVLTADGVLLDASPVSDAPASLQEKLRNEEQQELARVLAEEGGSRRATAERLGISERTLRHKLQKLRERGIEL